MEPQNLTVPTPQPTTPSVSPVFPKKSNLLVISLSVFLLVSISISIFFALQVQKLTKQLAQLRIQPTPSATPNSTSSWKTYTDKIFAFKYPSNLYASKSTSTLYGNTDKYPNIGLYLSKDIADEANTCIKNRLGTIEKPCSSALIGISFSYTTKTTEEIENSLKEIGLVRYTNSQGLTVLKQKDSVAGEGGVPSFQAYILKGALTYFVGISTKTAMCQETCNLAETEIYNEEFYKKADNFLNQILNTFEIFGDNDPIEGKYCGGVAGNMPENQCPSGYHCKLNGNYAVADDGVCTKD